MKKLFSAGKKAQNLAEKREKVQEALSDSNNLKLVQQYAKVLIGIYAPCACLLHNPTPDNLADHMSLTAGYFQVLGSFVSFKVRWPSFLRTTISRVQVIASTLKIDFLELPGLACVWSSVSYADKAYFKVHYFCYEPLILCSRPNG